MRPSIRKPVRWLLRALPIIGLLMLLWLAPVAYPFPLFDHNEKVGSITFHSDQPPDASLREVMHEVNGRLQSLELYDETTEYDVFLCHSQSRYRFFARLTLIPSHVPGYNLSQFDYAFVSLPALHERRLNSGGFPEYTAIGGELAHAITHELVHDCAVARLGFFPTRRLPPWKSEGYAEYAAGRMARRADSSAGLRERIDILKYSIFDKRTRDYYSWGLVVEYLCEERGYRFEDVMHDSTTWEQAYEEMMAWYDAST